MIDNAKILEDVLFQSLSVTSDKWITITEVFIIKASVYDFEYKLVVISSGQVECFEGVPSNHAKQWLHSRRSRADCSE